MELPTNNTPANTLTNKERCPYHIISMSTMKALEPLTPKSPSTAAERRIVPLAQDPNDNHSPFFWQPPASTATKLMMTGATVGTAVDSLHNQVLLEYHVAVVHVPSPFATNTDVQHWLLASSWTVPPLLAVAYLVLGAILPRVVQKLLSSVGNVVENNNTRTNKEKKHRASVVKDIEQGTAAAPPPLTLLRGRALWAVSTTAMIVKLSDVLERHPEFSLSGINLDIQHLVILFTAAVVQWWTLDRTTAAFILAAVAAYGGPLGE